MTGATLADEDTNSMLDYDVDCDVVPDANHITDAVATDALVKCNWRQNEVKVNMLTSYYQSVVSLAS